MTALFLAAQLLTAAAVCTTPDPGAGFVCHNGGWLPPNHPSVPVAPEPPTQPTGEPFGPKFRVGRHYVRGSSDVFISAAGQLPDGTPVLFAVCQSLGDGCFAVHYVRLFPIAATSHDWTEVP